MTRKPQRSAKGSAAPRPGRPDSRRSGDPARRGAAAALTNSSSDSVLRVAIATRSKPVVAALSMLPSLAIPGLMLLLMLVGLAAPVAFALPAIAIILVFVGWLAFLSWPVLTFGPRVLRVAMLLLLLACGVGRYYTSR
ncbi:MAG: DUF6703 family protein [Nocardioidaceae bacterium]